MERETRSFFGDFPGSEREILEDRQLVERAKGEKEAFDKLYVKYLKKVYTYIYYRVGNVEDAEDLTSDVFLQALLHLDGYKDQGLSFSAWLLRIAHNMVANWHRERSRKPMAELEKAEGLSGMDALPEDLVEREEERRKVRQAILALPPERQQALILRFAEGMKHREIAEVMGKSAVAVKVLVHRSLVSVHQQIKLMERGDGR